MTAHPVYIGVDPGTTGALAFLHNGSLTVVDVPTLMVRRGRTDKAHVDVAAVWRTVACMLDLAGEARAVIEAVGGVPGQSASAAFNFGRAAGQVEAVLTVAGARISYVAPRVWQMGLQVRGGKDGSRARASQLFPEHAHLFRRVKDDGRADAVLIAEYGRRNGL